MLDLTDLWDYDDPQSSEARFREALADATPRDAQLLRTQVARALGLQERFEEGLDLLDEIVPLDDEIAAWVHLERGRLHRSAGRPEQARPELEEAVLRSGDVDHLRVDALHMLAQVVPPEESRAVLDEALRVARASADPRARDWDASLLNNAGMTYAEAGEWAEALATFEQALAARVRQGKDDHTRVARWTVGWALRHLGRTDEALALQRALRAELDAAGAEDPYVDEELALLEQGPV
jgi:tetratricopeptide (TPR) repeat protein